MKSVGVYLLLALVLGSAAGITWWDHQDEVGPAPTFALTTTGAETGANGTAQPMVLEDYRGQTVLLDFMAVNCLSCRTVTALVLEPLQEEHPEVQILGVDAWAGQLGETNEELIKLQAKEGAYWPHALDTDRVALRYSVFQLPTILLIDPDGNIVYRAEGIPTYDEVESAVLETQAGEREPIGNVRLGLFALAGVAGAASLLAPCSVALLPAYLGYLVQRKDAGLGRAGAMGAVTAAGMVSLYAMFAVVLYFANGVLLPILPYFTPVMGLLLIVFGILMMRGGSWDGVAQKLGMGRFDGRRGFFTFGVGYGLAAFGCTGPIFLPILVTGFAEGAFTGLIVFAIYAFVLGLGLVLASMLVAAGEEGPLRKVLANSERVSKISAVLMVAAGLYLIWFEARALGWI